MHSKVYVASDLTADARTARKQKDLQYPAPKTFLEWWQQLLTGRLAFRWHYLAYLALWLHSMYRFAKIASVATLHTGRPPAASVSQFDMDDDF